MNNDIDKLRESELTDHLKKEEQELSLVDHLREVTEEKKDLERQLAEARELLMRCRDTIQASIVEEGISDSRRLYRTELYNYVQEQLKEKGDDML